MITENYLTEEKIAYPVSCRKCEKLGVKYSIKVIWGKSVAWFTGVDEGSWGGIGWLCKDCTANYYTKD